jgi:hypothetical protein
VGQAQWGRESDVCIYGMFLGYLLGVWMFYVSSVGLFRRGLEYFKYCSYCMLLVLCEYALNRWLRALIVSGGQSEK